MTDTPNSSPASAWPVSGPARASDDRSRRPACPPVPQATIHKGLFGVLDRLLGAERFNEEARRHPNLVCGPCCDRRPLERGQDRSA